MLTIHTGENCLLEGALIRKIGRSLAQEDCAQYIVVPRQLTLMTERMLLDGLKLRGSFRMRVLSPARLCGLIFDETGLCEGTRIDDRGRVMLVRSCIKGLSDQLSIYRNAHLRRGFAEKCASQLELFMQGGVTGDDLRACAEESGGLGGMKLRDLALLLDHYREHLFGRYQDGESELIMVAGRVSGAKFIAENHIWFFGFDLMPPTLTGLIAQIAACSRAELFLPLKNDSSARDYDCYLPMERQLGRIIAACRESHAETVRIAADGENSAGEIAHLANEIYAYPVQKWTGGVENIHLSMARDPRSECMRAAAQCRQLAMNGMKYADMQILCADLDAYRPLLMEAFQVYDVPLFLSGSRAVSRMGLAQCLLSALRIIEKGFRSEDVFTLMRTGYAEVDRDEADRLANYAVRRGLEGNRWLRPLNRGDAAEIEELEPVRRRLMEPIANFRENLRAAEDLRAQLTAVFHFLEEIHAYEKSMEIQSRLMEGGLKESAGELAQAWNRIIGALDQMAELMDGRRMAVRELVQTLSESLDAASVKALPQSGDAVYAQAAGRMLMQKNGALFILGLADRSGGRDDGLLSPMQKKNISERTKAYLGPDESDAARMRRYYLKSALGMCETALYLSYPMSNIDGSALRPDMSVALIREIFPELTETGGVTGDELLISSGRSAAAAAANAAADVRDGVRPDDTQLRAAAALRRVGESLPDARDSLRKIGGLLLRGDKSSLDPASAKSIYGKMQAMSITRLERFANCPFAHFAHYGLRPSRVEPFELDRRDEGNFLHDAAHEFLKRNKNELNAMAPEEADQRMSIIAEEMLANLRMNSPMEDSAAVSAQSRALKNAACRCARVLAEHMRGSKFHADQLERDFGREDGRNRLMAGDVTLEGRIDRVDSHSDGGSLRVIDFKLGGKALSLAGVYHGLQLQLPVYLGAAMKQKNARSAGVYYFNLDEGIVNSQSTDKNEIEKLRSRDLRMNGLLPEDEKLLADMTDDPEKVFYGQFTKDKQPYSSVPCADDVNFERLVNHAVKMARMHIDAMRMGQAAASPASFAGREPCGYCDYRPACLFDPKIDADRVRRKKNLKWNEVFDLIARDEQP